MTNARKIRLEPLSKLQEEKARLASPDCAWCSPNGILTNFEQLQRILLSGPPHWGSTKLDSKSKFGIPCLSRVELDSAPTISVPFDKLTTCPKPDTAIVDFYVDDRKLLSLLRNPERFVSRLEGHWGVISPDYSVWLGRSASFGALATWCNRSIGLVFESRGLRVIPQIRWTQKEDYDHCFDGVPLGSVVAISNKGSWNDLELRHAFLAGLPVLVERLKPRVIFLHGHDSEEIRRIIGPDVEVHAFRTHRQNISLAS